MNENISLENSFKKVLRKYGYYYVRTGDNSYMFIKHDDRIGGIYFELQNKAKMRIEQVDFIQTFDNRKTLNKFLNQMENELNYLSPELGRTLTRTQIKKIIKKVKDTSSF
ncbi:MAG: hypothetical protein ACTSWR_03400 [Candidatus Helarchaeota archaeon]